MDNVFFYENLVKITVTYTVKILNKSLTLFLLSSYSLRSCQITYFFYLFLNFDSFLKGDKVSNV